MEDVLVILIVAAGSGGGVKSCDFFFDLSAPFCGDLHGGISSILAVEIVESLGGNGDCLCNRPEMEVFLTDWFASRLDMLSVQVALNG